MVYLKLKKMSDAMRYF